MAKERGKSLRWTQIELPGHSLTEAERGAVLASSAKGFALLREILKADLEACHKDRSSREGYDNPAWAFAQADLNGVERTIRKMLDLLEPVCYNVTTN